MKSATKVFLLAVLGANALTALSQKSEQDPVDYVSPNIGGIGQLLTATIPYVQTPHGMARLAPVTTPGITDRYLADKIYGFPAGPAILMASVGKVGTNPAAFASEFDHDFETATPYYYQADLLTWGTGAEFTATNQAAYYRFTFPASEHAHLSLSLADDATLTVVGEDTVEGSQKFDGAISKTVGTGKETRQYFYLKFSRPFGSYETWQKGSLSQSAKQAGDQIGFVSDFASTGGQVVEARVGISFISSDQARRNLEREIPEWGFEQVKAGTRAVWNKSL
jgi:putative alpha-1,2-mannosidase